MKSILPIAVLALYSVAANADDLVFADSFEVSPDFCTGTPADIPGFTRKCDGIINYPFSGDIYGGPMTRYENIEGLWPGSPPYVGQAAVFNLSKFEYVSFAFRPNTPHAVKWSANASYGAGGWISVSASPGQFTNALCGLASGSSNNLIFANNGYGGAPLKCRNLNPDQYYYLNIVNANSAGTALCHVSDCPMAYTPLVVQ
ncbi:MAG TPA: hypothetical protein VF132_08900 [Rudaea sp.]